MDSQVVVSTVENAVTRDISSLLSYSGRDVENVAEQMGVSVSDAETAVILDRLDREIDGLARRATETAVQVRIEELLRVVEHAHEVSGDD